MKKFISPEMDVEIFKVMDIITGSIEEDETPDCPTETPEL